ncbi:MAG: acyltransferase [Bacteroidales bacterium]
MRDKIKLYLEFRPKLKRRIHRLIVNEVRVRPRLWIRLLRPLYTKRGRGSKIYRSARLDITPFSRFIIASNSIIESRSVVNNGVGDVIIGSNTILGIGSALIGPVVLGSNVIVAQNVVLSGMDHNYNNIATPIKKQGVSVAPIVVGDGVWIGANSVVTKGSTIGKNSVVAAGSVVRGEVPPYSVVAGSPAIVVKRYCLERGEWEKV